jgi:hypothetical protein
VRSILGKNLPCALTGLSATGSFQLGLEKWGQFTDQEAPGAAGTSSRRDSKSAGMIRKVVRKPALSSQEEPWVREETWKLKVVLNSKLRGQCFSWGSVEPLKVIEGVYFIIVTVCRWMQVRAPCNGTDEMVRGGGSWRGRCKCETSLSGCWPPVGI